MNIAPLFKKFDELADAPERIPALRKVILAYLLHAAVNSPGAFSRAGTLRAAHETRRRELIKSAARKEVPTVPFVVDEDLPPSLSDIPAGLFDRLGNIASIEKGLSQIQSTTPGKYPLVVTAETRSSSESFDFEGAAAIIPLVSSTGHGDASLKRLHYQEGRYAVGNILAVVKPICPDLLRARFIYEYLSAFKEELLVSRMVGTANVSLTVNKVKEVPVPLVSGPVLSRIDELMALCDRLEEQQEERETRHAALARASLSRFAEAPTPANLEWIFHRSYPIPPADLRKAILTLAIQGKLVPQDPNDEPAETLIARISQLRRTKKTKDYPQVDPDSVPFEAPYLWSWVRLGNLALSSDSGWSPQCGSESRSGNEWGVLKVSAVSWGGFDPEANKALPSGMDARPECEVRPGDFLLSRANTEELVARSVVVEQTPPRLMMSDKIVRFTFPDEIEKSFINLANLSDPSREYYMRNASGTSSSMKNIGRGVMCNLPIALPPLAEQHRIVTKVDQLMALVDALETQLAASRATAANLLSALVAELTTAAPPSTSVPASRADAPVANREPEFIRSVFAAEVIERLHAHETFGQVKLQKVLHLAEYIFQLPEIDSHPLRYAAGPHDPQLIREIEHGLRARDWFSAEPRPDGPGHVYRPLSGAGSHRDAFTQLWPEQAPLIRAFLDELRAWKTERCERFATLYAAWNDLLIWGQKPTDATILEQVLEKWDPAKKRIPSDLWLDSLRWMRDHGYTPTGFGRATTTSPQPELQF